MSIVKSKKKSAQTIFHSTTLDDSEKLTNRFICVMRQIHAMHPTVSWWEQKRLSKVSLHLLFSALGPPSYFQLVSLKVHSARNSGKLGAS